MKYFLGINGNCLKEYFFNIITMTTLSIIVFKKKFFVKGHKYNNCRHLSFIDQTIQKGNQCNKCITMKRINKINSNYLT